MEPRLVAAQSGPRNEREARTLCEILDFALKGMSMRLVMTALGRLKAIETVTDPGGGGWAVARHHELIPKSHSSMVTGRDRENATRDHRDEQKIALSSSPYRPQRDGGGDRGGRRQDA